MSAELQLLCLKKLSLVNLTNEFVLESKYGFLREIRTVCFGTLENTSNGLHSMFFGVAQNRLQAALMGITNPVFTVYKINFPRGNSWSVTIYSHH